MPDYTFECEKCSNQIVLFFTMPEYDKQHKRVKCPSCKGPLIRNFLADNVNGFVNSLIILSGTIMSSGFTCLPALLNFVASVT